MRFNTLRPDARLHTTKNLVEVDQVANAWVPITNSNRRDDL